MQNLTSNNFLLYIIQIFNIIYHRLSYQVKQYNLFNMLILPTEKSRPATTNPKTLILFGKPKAGKSTLMAALDNNLIIDLENGYQALSAMVVQARSVQDFADIANAIREKIKENDGKFPYKYITIDNATRLEEMCLPYACQL